MTGRTKYLLSKPTESSKKLPASEKNWEEN